MSKKRKAPRLTNEDLTDGIAIDSWTVEYNDKEITYSTWDFAGQTVYYNTHQVIAVDYRVNCCLHLSFACTLLN
jgi:GTPase SAR1 family protein